MSKKLLALAAFAALILPATASAANKPTLRDNAGVVNVGALVTGTNVGNVAFWNTGLTTKQFTCTTAKLTGEVTKNGADTIEAKLTTGDLSGTGSVNKDNNLPECTDSFGGGFAFTFTRLPLIFSSTPAMATDEFQITGTGGNLRFDLVDTSVGTCEYEALSLIKGDLTTGGTQSTFTVRNTAAGSAMKLIAGGFLCPTSGQLEMKFTMETDNAGAEPIWVESTP